ncbi:MAG: hypothetical protein WCK89_25895, partial [bacterium]
MKGEPAGELLPAELLKMKSSYKEAGSKVWVDSLSSPTGEMLKATVVATIPVSSISPLADTVRL